MLPARVLERCRRRRVDRVAITDHNPIDGALEAHSLAPDRVVIGEEIMPDHGELLGYYLREQIPAGLSPQETIDRLRGQGAVISVSHPFDSVRKGSWAEAVGRPPGWWLGRVVVLGGRPPPPRPGPRRPRRRSANAGLWAWRDR